MKVSDLQIKHCVDVINPQKVNYSDRSHHKVDNSKVGISKESFSEILENNVSKKIGLKFSNHAAKRINERGIQITPENVNRLERGIKDAEVKGAKNSLIIVDNDVYVVSIKNRTVITAVTKETTRSNVFTNIDSVGIY